MIQKKRIKQNKVPAAALLFLFLFPVFSGAAQEGQPAHESPAMSTGVDLQEPEVQAEPTPPDIGKKGQETLFGVIKQGGSVMFIIMAMLLLGMTLSGERLIYYYNTRAWKKSTVEERLRQKAGRSQSLFKEELENELRDDLQIYLNGLEKGLNLIHGIGNLAPLVGFFGTVIGMIKAFAAIATAAVVNAKVVAVGIQIALVTTAGGLAVAVFTLSFYHLFAHVVQTQTVHADELIEDFTQALPVYSQKSGV